MESYRLHLASATPSHDFRAQWKQAPKPGHNGWCPIELRANCHLRPPHDASGSALLTTTTAPATYVLFPTAPLPTEVALILLATSVSITVLQWRQLELSVTLVSPGGLALYKASLSLCRSICSSGTRIRIFRLLDCLMTV
jgi:hypothetical protein